MSFGQTIYLSKFYEEARTSPGVVFVNITEFRRGDVRTAGLVEPRDRIVLGPNEIPVMPTDPDYAGGLRIVVRRGRGMSVRLRVSPAVAAPRRATAST